MKESIEKLLSQDFSTMNKKELGVYFEKLIEILGDSSHSKERLQTVSQSYHQHQVQFFSESLALLEQTLSKVDPNSSVAKEIQQSIEELNQAKKILEAWNGNPLDLKQRVQLTKVIANPSSLLNPSPKNTMMALTTFKARIQRKIKLGKQGYEYGTEIAKNLGLIIDALNKPNKDFEELKKIKEILIHFQHDIKNKIKNPKIDNDYKELLEAIVIKLENAFFVFNQHYFSDNATIDRNLLSGVKLKSDLIQPLLDAHDILRKAQSALSSSDFETVNLTLNRLRNIIPNYDENIQQNLTLIYNQLLDVRDLIQLNTKNPQTIFNEFNDLRDQPSKKLFLDIFRKYSEILDKSNPLKTKLDIVISMIDAKALSAKNYTDISRFEIDLALDKLKKNLNKSHSLISDLENVKWLKIAELLKAEVIANALAAAPAAQQESLLSMFKKIRDSSSEPVELRSKSSQVIDIIAAKKILDKDKAHISENDTKLAQELYSRLNVIKPKSKSISQMAKDLKKISASNAKTHKSWVDENISVAQSESKASTEAQPPQASVSPRGGESGKD